MFYFYDFLLIIIKFIRIISYIVILIDYVYINIINSLVLGIVIVDILDYFLIFCVVGILFKKLCRKFFFRDYSKFNFDLYFYDICVMDWKVVID